MSKNSDVNSVLVFLVAVLEVLHDGFATCYGNMHGVFPSEVEDFITLVERRNKHTESEYRENPLVFIYYERCDLICQ